MENLIILRAGNKSLHPEWFKCSAAQEFDLVLSYFGDDEPPTVGNPLVHRVKGSKWEGIVSTLDFLGDRIDAYRYLWLPDDDLLLTVDDINRFFRACKQRNLDLAQPSLTWDSYYSHAVTLNNSALLYRSTNFVEIMAPCLKIPILKQVRPTLAENASGWGLDYLWPKIINNQQSIGIVDEVMMRHTRPVGSAGHGIKASADKKAAVPHADTHQLISKYNLDTEIKIFSVVGKNLKQSSNHFVKLIYAICGAAPQRRRNPSQISRLFKEYF